MIALFCGYHFPQVIITTSNVLVINPEDENVLPFITELKMKISQPSLAVSGSYPSALNDLGSGGGAKVVIPSRSVAKLETLASLQMPFELKALEVCLDSVSAPDWQMFACLGIGFRCCVLQLCVEVCSAVAERAPLGGVRA
jgi:hypothetical protein